MSAQRPPASIKAALKAVVDTADAAGHTATRQVRRALQPTSMESVGYLMRELARAGHVRFDRHGIQLLKRSTEPVGAALAPSTKRYVVTSAVSGSPAHLPFLKALERFCERMKATLMVVPIRYRNPTSPMEHSEDWFDPRLRPYITRNRVELCPTMVVMGDIATQPTASRPLSGLTTLSGTRSAIFGHTKIALESLATRMGEQAKLVMTTGACTQPRYSDSKSGKKGEFHHVFGAVVVEADGHRFHTRHLNANADGSFYDMGFKYEPDRVSEQDIKVLTLGDLHGVRADTAVMDATFFSDSSIVAALRPRKIVLHDVVDFQAASHHNRFFDSFALHARGQTNVKAELVSTFALIDRIALASPWSEIVVVDSNHHDHFLRWLGDPTKAHDTENALVYHETKAAMLRAIMAGDRHPSPLAFWGRELLKTNRVRFLKPGESLLVDNVEYGSHGHKGPNGARGSIEAFTKVGAKMVIGHSHTPGIRDGCYQVGTSSLLDMGYNSDSLSSWMHTHCIHYRNGKRTLVSIIDGHWRC